MPAGIGYTATTTRIGTGTAIAAIRNDGATAVVHCTAIAGWLAIHRLAAIGRARHLVAFAGRKQAAHLVARTR